MVVGNGGVGHTSHGGGDSCGGDGAGSDGAGGVATRVECYGSPGWHIPIILQLWGKEGKEGVEAVDKHNLREG